MLYVCPKWVMMRFYMDLEILFLNKNKNNVLCNNCCVHLPRSVMV